jgi:hypothetical protein
MDIPLPHRDPGVEDRPQMVNKNLVDLGIKKFHPSSESRLGLLREWRKTA